MAHVTRLCSWRPEVATHMKRVTVALLAAIGVHKTLSAEQKHDIVVALAQTAPGAVAAGGAQVVAPQSPPLLEGLLTMNSALALASLCFIVLQCGHLVWKWRRDARRDRERSDDRRNGRPLAPDSEYTSL